MKYIEWCGKMMRTLIGKINYELTSGIISWTVKVNFRERKTARRRLKGNEKSARPWFLALFLSCLWIEWKSLSLCDDQCSSLYCSPPVYLFCTFYPFVTDWVSQFIKCVRRLLGKKWNAFLFSTKTPPLCGDVGIHCSESENIRIFIEIHHRTQLLFTELINNVSDGIWKKCWKIKDKLCARSKIEKSQESRRKKRFVSCLCYFFIRIQSDYCLWKWHTYTFARRSEDGLQLFLLRFFQFFRFPLTNLIPCRFGPQCDMKSWQA